MGVRGQLSGLPPPIIGSLVVDTISGSGSRAELVRLVGQGGISAREPLPTSSWNLLIQMAL